MVRPSRRAAVVDATAVLGAFALDPLAALLAPGDPTGPVARSHDLIAAERALGLYVEPAASGWLSAHGTLLAVAAVFYVWVHVPATVGALVWAWLEHPARVTRLRDTFVATQLGLVAGYVALPTAPPRLVPGAGFQDSLTAVWGQSAANASHLLQSPYAAMPSGHVAFAAIAAGTVWWCARSPWIRALALTYPVVVTVVIVSTANHLWLDAIGGLLVAAAGAGVAWVRERHLARRARGTDAAGGRRAPWSAAPASPSRGTAA